MNRQSTTGLHQRMEAITDLSTISPVSDDIIVSCLRERFMSDSVYTNVGSSGLVAVNPHKYISSNADSVMYKYAAEYRDTEDGKEKLPPHVFQLAGNAYYHMRRTTQDQCLLFRYAIYFFIVFTRRPKSDLPTVEKLAVGNQKIVDWLSKPS
jgi:chitin synthase